MAILIQPQGGKWIQLKHPPDESVIDEWMYLYAMCVYKHASIDIAIGMYTYKQASKHIVAKMYTN